MAYFYTYEFRQIFVNLVNNLLASVDDTKCYLLADCNYIECFKERLPFDG